jgi:diguanylate cyclase (GGDEF)-like protein
MQKSAPRSAGGRKRQSPALRLARKAWHVQYLDPEASRTLARQALERGQAAGDTAAAGWARLALGFYLMRYGAPGDAAAELARAQAAMLQVGDRAGELLAQAGIGRTDWLQGRYRETLDRMLPLRDEGMRVLRHDERGILLNVIAGCYSSLGLSAEAFAYMYQALRESGAARSHGFDVVLYNNLAHELIQLGDCHEALEYLAQGIERCAQLNNARLMLGLLQNRVACLTDLDQAGAAIADVHRVLATLAEGGPRSARGAQFERMAIAVLRAGDLRLGERLVAWAGEVDPTLLEADDRVELVVARAELERARGRLDLALQVLHGALPLPAEGPSLRVRGLFFQALADLYERRGDAARSLECLRAWQAQHVERARLASLARYQAASLQTELLRLQHERDQIDARRQSSERARAELATINRQLSQKIAEVQSLQDELKQQAVRDFLTGCFNRRHLNDVLPALVALAERSGEPLAAVIIDLDHFKAVNDRHGHAAGDLLLAQFGALLAQRVRRSDVACRYGGEEFCLLMPRTSAAAARNKVAALLRAWRGAEFRTADRSILRNNTFSAGVADSLQVPGSGERLLQAADACVLEAKRLGRDRVVALDARAQAA